MSKTNVADAVRPSLVTIVEIEWDEGVESFELDVNNLNESTTVWKTVQYVDEEETNYYYTTTSTTEKLGDGFYEISIQYEHARNKRIPVEDSWWGTSKIALKRGDRNGVVRWYDAYRPENNCTRPFRITTGLPLVWHPAAINEGRAGVSRVNNGDVKPIPRFVVGQQYKRSVDINERFGGSKQSGISPSSRVDAIFVFTGESGEQHGYNDHEEVDENGCRVFHYSGEGQVGDMTLTRGNLAITRHSVDGKAIHVFKTLGKSKPVQYLGEYLYLDHYETRGVDREGQMRKVIVFKLFREEDLPLLTRAAQQGDVEPPVKDLSTARALAIAAAAAQKEAGRPAKGSRNLYVRSRQVRDYVLLRANGKCELCSAPAPFLKPDGSPYLEPHHTTRVSDGGPDHPLHVGALCPSCHREIHFGQNGAARNAELQMRLQQIEVF